MCTQKFLEDLVAAELESCLSLGFDLLDYKNLIPVKKQYFCCIIFSDDRWRSTSSTQCFLDYTKQFGAISSRSDHVLKWSKKSVSSAPPYMRVYGNQLPLVYYHMDHMYLVILREWKILIPFSLFSLDRSSIWLVSYLFDI